MAGASWPAHSSEGVLCGDSQTQRAGLLGDTGAACTPNPVGRLRDTVAHDSCVWVTFSGALPRYVLWEI